MDLPKIAFGAPSRLLRRLGALQKLLDLGASEPSAAPQHGGVFGAARSDNDLDTDRRRQRRSTLAALLGLPPGTDVDIVVDASAEELTFVVRDRATGRNLRTVPEAEARDLIERFSARHGNLIDRSV